ncbi:hypothetical protein DMENIID0001_060410 [Sergentomyia squamirostris]
MELGSTLDDDLIFWILDVLVQEATTWMPRTAKKNHSISPTTTAVRPEQWGKYSQHCDPGNAITANVVATSPTGQIGAGQVVTSSQTGNVREVSGATQQQFLPLWPQFNQFPGYQLVEVTSLGGARTLYPNQLNNSCLSAAGIGVRMTTANISIRDRLHDDSHSSQSTNISSASRNWTVWNAYNSSSTTIHWGNGSNDQCQLTVRKSHDAASDDHEYSAWGGANKFGRRKGATFALDHSCRKTTPASAAAACGPNQCSVRCRKTIQTKDIIRSVPCAVVFKRKTFNHHSGQRMLLINPETGEKLMVAKTNEMLAVDRV